MNTAFPLLALPLLGLPGPAGGLPSEGLWIEDFDEAVEVAREEDKHLLVDFTGSDWCGWCIRLHDEVFAHEEFEQGVQDDFVLVKLDFPRDPEVQAQVPDPERNQELAQEYGYAIPGFPTVLLMTADGQPFARTGYRGGGPEAYVEHLVTVREEGLARLKDLRDAIGAYESAEGDRRAELLEGLLARLEQQQEHSPFIGVLLEPARRALAEGTPAQREQALAALIDHGEVDAEILATVRELDPKNEQGLWFDALSALISGTQTEADLRVALEQMDAFVDAGLEPDDTNAPEFYFMGALGYHRFGETLCEGLPEGEVQECEQRARERARKYAALARPLWDDQQHLALLDEILEG